MNTRNDLGKFFQKHFLTGIGAEVGCLRGEFSKRLARDYKGKILSIDYFDPSDLEYDPKNEELCRSNLKGTNCQIIKGASVEVAKTIPSNSLDWVYLDSDHRYPGIKADLKEWFHKIRKGGVMSGHDYVYYTVGDYVFGVIEAVDEFCREYGYQIKLLDAKKFASWYFIK